MGHTKAANLFEEILEEEKAADEKLTALAEGGINQAAADEAHSAEEQEGEDEEPTAKAAAKKKPTSKAKASSRRWGDRAVVLIQLLLPTTFPREQRRSAWLQSRKPGANLRKRVTGYTAYVRSPGEGNVDRARWRYGTRRCRDGGSRDGPA